MIPTLANIRKAIYCLNKKVRALKESEEDSISKITQLNKEISDIENELNYIDSNHILSTETMHLSEGNIWLPNEGTNLEGFKVQGTTLGYLEYFKFGFDEFLTVTCPCRINKLIAHIKPDTDGSDLVITSPLNTKEIDGSDIIFTFEDCPAETPIIFSGGQKNYWVTIETVYDKNIRQEIAALKLAIEDLVGLAPEDLDTIAEAAEAIVGMQGEIDDIENSVNSVQEKVGNESVAPYKPDATYVDLGLTSGNLWATCNLGAGSPEEAGKYYQWGDTQGYTADQVGSGEGKKLFAGDFSDYKFGTQNMSKYNDTDGLTELEAVDDAATSELGAPWKIPSTDDWQELVTECTWTWKQVNGINGYEVAGSNGNKIFIPTTGICVNGSIYERGNHGFYCSNSILDTNIACFCYFNMDYSTPDAAESRCYGYNIRPIATSTPPSQSITEVLNKHTESLNALTNPAIVQTYQLARYDLPDGVYAFGVFGDDHLPQQGAGLFKIKTVNGERLFIPIWLQPRLNGIIINPYAHTFYSNDGNYYHAEVIPRPDNNDEIIAFFSDLCAQVQQAVILDNGDTVVEPGYVGLRFDKEDSIFISCPDELTIDYFIQFNIADYPSFNGYLAVYFNDEGQAPELYNWIFKVTQGPDHNVRIEVPGNATTLYSFSNDEITTRTVTPDVSSNAVAIVKDIFRHHYNDLVMSTQGAQVSIDFANPFIDEVPDKVLWWIGV